MGQHTPGPWEWRDCGDSTVLWGAHGMRPIVLDCVRAGMQGASFRVRCGEKELMSKVTACSLNYHPDTKLIAAAPDLLEACIAYARGKVETREAERMMLAAIAKAT